MTTHHYPHPASPRREKTARRAFYVWMAAYVAVILAIAILHTLGGTEPSTIDVNGIRTQQAKVTGPQSAIIGPMPQPASWRVDG